MRILPLEQKRVQWSRGKEVQRGKENCEELEGTLASDFGSLRTTVASGSNTTWFVSYVFGKGNQKSIRMTKSEASPFICFSNEIGDCQFEKEKPCTNFQTMRVVLVASKVMGITLNPIHQSQNWTFISVHGFSCWNTHFRGDGKWWRKEKYTNGPAKRLIKQNGPTGGPTDGRTISPSYRDLLDASRRRKRSGGECWEKSDR